MEFSYHNPLSKVICLDVSKATIFELEKFVKENDYVQPITIEYLENIIENNKTNPDNLENIIRVYLHDSFAIAITKQKMLNTYDDIEVSNIFLEELKELPLITHHNCQEEIESFEIRLMKNDKVRMTEIMYLKFYQFYKTKLFPTKYKIPFFFEHLIAIDVSHFNLKMKEIAAAATFKSIYSDIKLRNPETKIINNLLVQKMYYFQSLLLAYSVKLIGTEEPETWFWSDHYIEELLNIAPTYLV